MSGRLRAGSHPLTRPFGAPSPVGKGIVGAFLLALTAAGAPPPPQQVINVAGVPVPVRSMPPLPVRRTAPPAPPAAPSGPPMPSDEQCMPLPAPREKAAFITGETLDYDIDALGAKAGTMTMRVLPAKDGGLPIEIHVETNSFFSKVRRVNGTGTSLLSQRTFHPLRYTEDATEDEIHRLAEVTFRPNRLVHLYSVVNGSSGEADFRYAHDGLDVAGTIYLLRQLPLKEGQSICFDSYGIRRMWRVWGKVEAREHVSMPLGEFDAFHIAGVAARIDNPRLRRDIHVWITDDARHLPLAALGSIDLGTVRATLTGFQRPGEKAKAETKANLKW